MSSPHENASGDSGSFVFLSHNSLDKAEVERLAYALVDRGVLPWLDKWHLIPGRPWQVEIEAALRDAGAVVLCVGHHGLGRVQRPELLVAQDHAWHDVDRPLIPVLLPSAPEEPDLPDFLRQLTWIDFRGGIDAAGLERLTAALEGRSLGAGPGRGDGTCPYQGLAAFDEEDAKRFFGREQEVASLVAKLRRGDRLLTLVGASGAGKSSLLLAGLLPAVRTGEINGAYDWLVARLRPGPRPVHQLAVRLTRLEGGTPEDLAVLERTLRGSHEGLSDKVDLMLAASPQARMLVVVDQFEEIFTQVETDVERGAFVSTLLHAATAFGASW